MYSQVPESQATMAPTVSASSSTGIASAGGSTPRSQGVIEPMDTETQESRTYADWRHGGLKNTEADGKMQVDGRTQADRKTQMDIVAQESERTESDGSAQKDVVVEGRTGTQVERTQEDRKTQAGEKTQVDRTQEVRGTQSEGSVPIAIKVQSEKSVTNLSPQSRAPELSRSEGPSSQIIACFEQSPERSSVPEKPGFMLRSGEAAETASGNQEEMVLGSLSGGLRLPAQLLPEGSLEQTGGGRCWGPEWSGPVKDKPEDSLFQCPQEEQPGAVLSVDLGGSPPAGRSPNVPTLPSPAGTGLTDSSQQGLPSTPTSQHTSAAAFLPSGDQALLSSAPSVYLGPGTPTHNHPPETVAASNEGACAKMSDVGGRPTGTQSCDPGLIDSLKNYLLLLLKLSSTETSGGGTKSQEGAAPRGLAPSPTLAPTLEVAGLSPQTSRRILERVENDHLVQSAQTLLLSPCTSRRITGLLDREVQAGQQALAAARSPGSSPLTVPAIVVGEEEGPGLTSEESSKGEGEVPLERPGLLGTSQESGVGGLLGEAGGQAASSPEPLSAESRAQEPSREEEFPQEAPTGLPAATPEELALGARRKRFLPKARAAGDGEAAKPEERESPTVSPRGPRKGLTPGSPGTLGREKRSPTQGRKAGLLEVPRAEEEQAAGDLGSSPKPSGPDAELTLDEDKQETPGKPRKAKDLLKGEQRWGLVCGSTERAAQPRTLLQLLGWHMPARDTQRPPKDILASESHRFCNQEGLLLSSWLCRLEMVIVAAL